MRKLQSAVGRGNCICKYRRRLARSDVSPSSQEDTEGVLKSVNPDLRFISRHGPPASRSRLLTRMARKIFPNQLGIVMQKIFMKLQEPLLLHGRTAERGLDRAAQPFRHAQNFLIRRRTGQGF